MLIAAHGAHANFYEDAEHILQQGSVYLLPLPLKLYKLEDGVPALPLHVHVYIVCSNSRQLSMGIGILILHTFRHIHMSLAVNSPMLAK